MKVNAEIFLSNLNKYNFENKIIFLSGNEEGLIYKIQNLILQNLSIKNKIEKFDLDFKKTNDSEFFETIKNQSLFSEYRILFVSNSKDSLIKIIEKNVLSGVTIIINGHEARPSSKIKKFFDSHKEFYSVPCYKLSRQFKKKIIDVFLIENEISLSKEAYWFLVENADDEYQLLENELKKISNFGKEIINIKEISILLSSSSDADLNNLFFLCFSKDRGSILDKSQKAIKSSVDARIFLQIVKNFSNILLITSENNSNMTSSELVKNYLPKYLFKQTENFKFAINKTSSKKLIHINRLLQKTEFFLRKNEENYLIVIQRFMLNYSQIIK